MVQQRQKQRSRSYEVATAAAAAGMVLLCSTAAAGATLPPACIAQPSSSLRPGSVSNPAGFVTTPLVSTPLSVSHGFWASVAGPRRRASGGLGETVVSMVASKAAKARRTQNVDGNLFVDESCIDCDTCRWMQGSTFVSAGGKSAVIRQPETEEDKRGAYRAMVACPTGSIRLESPDPLVKDAANDFPFPVDTERLPGVFHLGYHGENSFGCSPWFVVRDDGNVMMDSPRFSEKLAKMLERKGGVSLMIMSHIDDVGDHDRWKKRFPEMRRVLHHEDVQSYGETRHVEIQLSSSSADGQLAGADYWDLADDLRVLHTPGHSRGSITLLYRATEAFQEDEGIAFTGDHLAFSGRTGALTGFPRYGWNHTLQGDSMELLARPELDFRWILPGHGRMIRFSDHADRISQIHQAAANIKAGRS